MVEYANRLLSNGNTDQIEIHFFQSYFQDFYWKQQQPEHQHLWGYFHQPYEKI